MKTRAMQIYIHIPFCVRKCNYCDFLSFTCDDVLRTKYIDAVKKEIEAAADNYSKSQKDVSTIFIGGGTPSSIDGIYIEEIVNKIRDSFNVADNAEITIECNPGTIDSAKLKHYKEAGINRISMGLQTTDDIILKKLGRIHTYEQFLESYDCVRNAGIKNVNVDIMSGLPGQSSEMYTEGLRKVCKLEPEHISAYSLIIEEGTPFYSKYNEVDGMAVDELPDEENEREQYYNTKVILKEYGYERYEISNYSKPGYECAHNLGYWKRNPYIGFGIGAASFVNEVRYNNTDNINKYIANPLDKAIRTNIQKLMMEEQMEEFMFLGLRMCNGISEKDFMAKFGKSMYEVFGNTIDKYVSFDMLYYNNDILKLTDKGIDVSNVIFSDFIL